jgi:hypothetical protein
MRSGHSVDVRPNQGAHERQSLQGCPGLDLSASDQLDQDQSRGQVRNACLIEYADKGGIIADNGVGTGSEEEVQRFLFPSTQATFLLQEHCRPGVPDHGSGGPGLQYLTDGQCVRICGLDPSFDCLDIHGLGNQTIPGLEHDLQDVGFC